MKVVGNAAHQPKLKEHHVVKEIIQRLGWCGIKVRQIVERIPVRKKNGKMARPSTAGIPDLVGWVPRQKAVEGFYHSDRPVFIEVKRPGGDRRPAQEAFIAEAKADGCIAFFAESWEDVVKGFAGHGIDISKKGGIEWPASGK